MGPPGDLARLHAPAARGPLSSVSYSAHGGQFPAAPPCVASLPRARAGGLRGPVLAQSSPATGQAQARSRTGAAHPEGEGAGAGDADAEGALSPAQQTQYEAEARRVAREFRASMLAELESSPAGREQGAALRGAPARVGTGSAGANNVAAILKDSAERGQPVQRVQVPQELLPKVAIVGRPNVGKSALFNRIAGRELAIVHDEPGVTRDRRYTRAQWGRSEFLLIDTGGVLTPQAISGASTSKRGHGKGRRREAADEGAADDAEALTEVPNSLAEAALPSMIEKQAALAVEEADVIILVVDGQAGPTAADVDIAAWLRRQYAHKPVLLAVNKCESPARGLLQAAEFWSLGMTPLAVSAISGTGTGELLDAACTAMEEEAHRGGEDASAFSEALVDDDEGPREICAVAIVGRPNVGKSSLVNALLGEERSIVSPVSGTTRDAVDTNFTGPDGQKYTLIDTAGIRRRIAVAASGSRAEGLSVNRAFRAIRAADVVVLVIDAMLCVTEQDLRLAERIEKEGKACVVVVNKWDTIPEKTTHTMSAYELDVREKLRSLHWAPIVYTSATTGHRVQRILEKAREAATFRARRLSTATLNQVVAQATSFRQMPRSRAGKSGKIYYCTQAATCPPTFVFFVNDAKLFNEDYRRYMEKQIRQNVEFPGTPLRLLWRSKKKRVLADGEQPGARPRRADISATRA